VTNIKTSLRSFFSSIRLTVVLLIVMALLFMVGTFIPQRESAMEFAQRLSPGISSLFHALGLFDVYHSPLYYVLLGLLALNLTVCSLNRLPGSWKLYRTPHFPVPEGLFSKLPPNRVLLTEQNREACLSSLESLLKASYGAIEKDVKGGHVFFSIRKAGLSLFSVYGVHLSILFMIAGSVIGSVFGFEGYVNIGEGETTNLIDSRNGRDIHRLDFSVRCDKFTLETYANGMPKTYRSDLTFLKDGQPIRQGALMVNHPIHVNGYRFYQSSFGSAPGGRAVLNYSKGKGQGEKVAVSVGDRFDLKEGGAHVEILRIEGNLMKFGPGVKLDIASPQGRHIQFWVLQHIDEIAEMYPELLTQFPLFDPALFKPYRFFLKEIEQQYYTGLQVVRDPGVPLVALGAFLMVTGLILRHFMPHRRIWVRVDAAGRQTRISLAGRSRHMAALDRELDLLGRRIQEKGIV